MRLATQPGRCCLSHLRAAPDTAASSFWPQRQRQTGNSRRYNLAAAVDAAKCYTAVLALFTSGVDYWQRRRHGGHSWAMKEAMLALMLTRQRLDNTPAPGTQDHTAAESPRSPPPLRTPLPRLPEEMWLRACSFLRSADFEPRA